MSRTTIFHFFTFLVGASLLFTGMLGNASAAIVLPLLDVGDTYRIVFSTSNYQGGYTNSGSAPFDGYIRSGLADSLLALAPADQWRAIVSSSSGTARDHTVTQPGSDPLQFAGIFNTHGEIIATTYGDLWDGGIINPIAYDQTGVQHEKQVWTGTNLQGGISTNRYLGTSHSYYGYNYASNGHWINGGGSGPGINRSFYGISPVLTYSDPSQVVPEPSSIVIFSCLASCFVAWHWRRRKQEAPRAKPAARENLQTRARHAKLQTQDSSMGGTP